MNSDGPKLDLRNQYEVAVSMANVPTLLMVLVHLTSDKRWLEDRYRPNRESGFGENDGGGLNCEVQEEIRTAALEAIWENRDRSPSIASLSDEELIHMLEFAVDEDIPADYGSFMADDMSQSGLLRRPRDQTVFTRSSERSAIIIGGGISGLSMAMALGEARIPYVILERNDDLGGVWHEATYPGAGVDTPSHLYSFARFPHDWTHYFARRDEIREYLLEVAKTSRVRKHIRFGYEVVRARYEEANGEWEVTAVDQDGVEQVFCADLLMSAVGVFNNPVFPNIEGLNDFTGEAMFHASRWDRSVDLSGKRVTLVGSGATAMQAAPAIAEQVQSLTIVQRSPQWIAPFSQFATPIPEQVRFLLRSSPEYRWWYRQRLGWMFNDRLHASLKIDPSWGRPDEAVNAINDRHRKVFLRYINSELEGRPDLIEKSTPTYPAFGKRLLLDNGWYRMLKQSNVELISGSVDRVDGRSVVVSDGQTIDTDVLVLATGWDVVRFLGTYDVLGRGGQTLRAAWDDDDPKAYVGSTVPGFPNLFMLYGPNTQAGHGGSLISTLEWQSRHIVKLIHELDRRDARAVEVKPAVYEAYNQEIDTQHKEMIWAHDGMSTYYRNSKGRVVVPMPFRNVEFWHRLMDDSMDNYSFDSSPTQV